MYDTFCIGDTTECYNTIYFHYLTLTFNINEYQNADINLCFSTGLKTHMYWCKTP